MSAIKGLDSFMDVLALVNDPNKYKAKVEEIRKAVNDYTVVIESVVKLSEVNDYVVNIKATKEQTLKALADAQIEAESIKAKAKKFAEDKKKVLVAFEVTLNERQASLNIQDKVQKETEVALAKQTKDLAVFSTSLENKDKKLIQLAVELEDKKNKLLAAMS
jgi:hypothetical protein